MSVSSKRVPYLAAVSCLLAITLVFSLLASTVYASGQITNRSLKLENGTTDGGSKPHGSVKHFFTFMLPASTAGQSIVFKYCTNANIDAGGTCTTPTGLGTTGAGVTLGQAATGDASGATLVNTTPGAPLINLASTVAPTGSVSSTVQLAGVTNPDGTDCPTTPNGCTFFVNIQFWSGTGGTGTLLSQGTVAAAVNAQITLTGTMPESLIFCTGGAISKTSGIPDCTTATSGSITFNKLFSPTGSAFASSQMAASTNALSGYTITVSGAQLSSGTNHIPGIGATAKTSASTVGTSEFGLNLVADTDAAASTPALSPASAAITPASDGANFWGIAHTNFSTDSTYAFADSGPTGGTLVLNNIAGSDYSAGGPTGTGSPTQAQIYTATYMVNAAANQPAGTYTTTLTYICTATF
jgi:hypothetical protein